MDVMVTRIIDYQLNNLLAHPSPHSQSQSSSASRTPYPTAAGKTPQIATLNQNQDSALLPFRENDFITLHQHPPSHGGQATVLSTCRHPPQALVLLGIDFLMVCFALFPEKNLKNQQKWRDVLKYIKNTLRIWSSCVISGHFNFCPASFPDLRELRFISRIRVETGRERLDVLWDKNKQRKQGYAFRHGLI